MTALLSRQVSGAVSIDPRRRWTLSLLAVLWLAVQTAAVAGPPDERERLAIERRAVDARHADARVACQTRFLVNNCLEAARSQWRVALDGLRQRQLLLDDAGRRDRAASRMLQQRDRSQAQADQASSPVLQQPRRPTAAGTGTGTGAGTGAASAAETGGRPAAAPAAAGAASMPSALTSERQHQQAFDLRQQAAQEHQRAVDARNARQDKERSPAAGLPQPNASASASASGPAVR